MIDEVNEMDYGRWNEWDGLWFVNTTKMESGIPIVAVGAWGAHHPTPLFLPPPPSLTKAAPPIRSPLPHLKMKLICDKGCISKVRRMNSKHFIGDWIYKCESYYKY